MIVSVNKQHRWYHQSVCQAATADPKSIRSSNGQPLTVSHRLLLVPISMPPWIVKGCCLDFPVSGGILMLVPLTFSCTVSEWAVS